MYNESRFFYQDNKRRKDPGGMSIKGDYSDIPSQRDRFRTRDADFYVKRDESNSSIHSKTEKNLKNIVLTPDHRFLSGNESSGVELCKKLFGITIFEYSNGKAQWNHLSKDRKLVVQGVIEGSASYSSGRIHRGDMLVCINDVSVSWSNFSSLLNSLNRRKKVKLTFQSPRIVGPKSSYTVLKVPDNDLCFAVAGKRLADVQSELSGQACVALYLTLVGTSSEVDGDGKEDVIYAFPPEEDMLTVLRGLFITLSSALVDVVEQPATCSCLVVNETLVNVVYKQFGKDILVFAMPENRISKTVLTANLDSFCSLLELLFLDVKSAFTDCDRNWLDRVLALMFYENLSLMSPHKEMLLSVQDYHTVKLLNLSHDYKLICDEILNCFEAMDFDDYLEDQDLFSRRQYSVQGTSLFYKDYLLCSHLSLEHQRNMNLFMNYHGLLSLSARQIVSQVMVWQELKLDTSQESLLLPAGYRPNQTTSFLLIIGWNHYYLGAVIEAHGCSQPAHVQARPVSILLEQGKATLAELEAEDVHMSQCCEDSLINTNRNIRLASADKLFKKSFSARSSGREKSGSMWISEGQKQIMPAKSFSKSQFSRSKSADRLDERNDLSNAVLMRRQGSKLSYGSNDSTGSGSSTGPPKSKGSRVSSVADISGISHSVSLFQVDSPFDIKGRRLDRGIEATLFSYLHIDSTEGILIHPTKADMMEVHSDFQQQIIDNFSRTCHKIRALLKQKVTSRDTKQQSIFNTSAAGKDEDYKEVGILFSCTLQPNVDKRKQIDTQNYWVVGRCWPAPRSQEMYVCFHESASQSLVEMAFTLGFGI